MGEVVAYNDWEIRAQSFKSNGDRWRPKATVSSWKGGRYRIAPPVLPPLDAKFDTRQEADSCAVKIAKSWIDEHGQAWIDEPRVTSPE